MFVNTEKYININIRNWLSDLNWTANEFLFSKFSFFVFLNVLLFLPQIYLLLYISSILKKLVLATVASYSFLLF